MPNAHAIQLNVVSLSLPRRNLSDKVKPTALAGLMCSFFFQHMLIWSVFSLMYPVRANTGKLTKGFELINK